MARSISSLIDDFLSGENGERSKGFNSLRIEIQRKLHDLGVNDKFAFPEGENSPVTPLDVDLWKLFVIAEIRKYGDGTYKKTLESLLKQYDLEETSNDLVAGGQMVITSGSKLGLDLRKNNASTRLDSKKFVTELRKRGVTTETIEAAQKAATSKTSPAKYFSVVPILS